MAENNFREYVRTVSYDFGGISPDEEILRFIAEQTGSENPIRSLDGRKDAHISQRPIYKPVCSR